MTILAIIFHEAIFSSHHDLAEWVQGHPVLWWNSPATREGMDNIACDLRF